MTKQKQAALAAAAVDAVSQEASGKGIFDSFRAEGHHVFGKLHDGKEVNLTIGANEGAGLPIECAKHTAEKLNMDADMAHIVGAVLQLQWGPKGFDEDIKQAA